MLLALAITVCLCLAGVLNVEAVTAKMATSAQMAATAKMQMEMEARNPVRKVVKVLQDMQEKVTSQQADDKKLYDQTICWCQEKGVKIDGEIEALKDKAEDVNSDIKSTSAEKDGLKEKIDAQKEKFAEDEEDVRKAKALNKQEEEAYQQAKADYEKNIDALREAIRALEKGISSSFLQTPKAAVVAEIVKNFDMDESERDTLNAFLQQDSSYEPSSTEIFGMLKQMKDEMIDDLAKLMHDNEIRSAVYNALVGAKMKEEEQLKKMLEEYMRRLAEDGVRLAEDKGYRTDYYDSLLTDEEYQKVLHRRCHDYKKDYEATAVGQQKEIKTILDTINLLESDHSRELMRRVMPSPSSSFIQLQRSMMQVRQQARAKLRRHRGDPRLAFVAITLRSTKVNFDKIISMMDGLVGILKQEQKEDDKKKVWCKDGIQNEKQNLLLLKDDAKNLETIVAEKKQEVTDLDTEIKELMTTTSKLDQEVEAARKQRQEENTAYLSKLASNNAANTILNMAINRLNKYYNEEQYHSAIGYSLAQASPNWDVNEHKKDSGGAIGMLKEIVHELDLMTQKLKQDEEDAQKEHDEYIEQEKTKKDENIKMITDKQTALSTAEQEAMRYENELKTKQNQAMDDEKDIKALEAECNFLLQYYDIRKTARNQEIDNLVDAKAVLRGAETSAPDFMQTGQEARHLRGGQLKP